jgi:hypothetical protein
MLAPDLSDPMEYSNQLFSAAQMMILSMITEAIFLLQFLNYFSVAKKGELTLI